MESEPKKIMHMCNLRKSCVLQEMGKSLDRISNLPTEIIDEILKRMPIRDAVKTSLLSTCWRHKWMSIMSDLVFDNHSILPSVEQANKLVNFVYNVLLRHDGSNVSKFVIKNFLECICSDDLDRWIVILSRKMLKELELRYNCRLKSYQLPTCVFSCKELTTLKLDYCILKLPSGFQGFCHLTKLELHGVCITNEAFETLVTKCPLLVTVHVLCCNFLTHVKVCHAPNLTLFGISGVYKSIKFCNTPKLKMLGLFKLGPGMHSITRLEEVIDLLVGIHRIGISRPFVELSSSDVSPDKLPLIYPCLKFARLDVNFEDSRQILAILCLCRSSPNLEKLEIKVLSDQQSLLISQECFWESRLRQEENVCGRLKSLSMSTFKGMQHEMGFVQFFMLNAVVLEYVTIKWKGDGYKNHEKLCIEKKMMQFKKASSHAEIRFSSQA